MPDEHTEFDLVDRILRQLDDFGTSHAVVASAARIRKLGTARRRRRATAVGAAGAFAAAGVVTGIAMVPSPHSSGGSPSVAAAGDGGVAYRVLDAGESFDEKGLLNYRLMVLDLDDGCASMPATTVTPAAHIVVPSPTIGASARPDAGRCEVVLDVASGALVVDPYRPNEVPTGPCVSWPNPPAGYTAVTPAPVGGCPSAAQLGAVQDNIGWLLVADGKAHYVATQPAR